MSLNHLIKLQKLLLNFSHKYKQNKKTKTTNDNDQRPEKPTETQGACPDLRGTCVWLSSGKYFLLKI